MWNWEGGGAGDAPISIAGQEGEHSGGACGTICFVVVLSPVQARRRDSADDGEPVQGLSAAESMNKLCVQYGVVGWAVQQRNLRCDRASDDAGSSGRTARVEAGSGPGWTTAPDIE